MKKNLVKRSNGVAPDFLRRYSTRETVVPILQHAVSITRVTDFEELLEGIDPSLFSEDERMPYWAEIWPSAVALAQWITQRFDLSGKHVLELGCGLGLVGIVAALRGGRVLLTDYEEDSLRFARYNARRNGCRALEFRRVDWRSPPLRRRYDFILGSDVIYERRSFGHLVALLKRFLARGGVALLSEPRRSIAGPFFELLDQRGFICLPEVVPLHWEGSHQIAVYTISHKLPASTR